MTSVCIELPVGTAIALAMSIVTYFIFAAVWRYKLGFRAAKSSAGHSTATACRWPIILSKSIFQSSRSAAELPTGHRRLFGTGSPFTGDQPGRLPPRRHGRSATGHLRKPSPACSRRHHTEARPWELKPGPSFSGHQPNDCLRPSHSLIAVLIMSDNSVRHSPRTCRVSGRVSMLSAGHASLTDVTGLNRAGSSRRR